MFVIDPPNDACMAKQVGGLYENKPVTYHPTFCPFCSTGTLLGIGQFFFILGQSLPLFRDSERECVVLNYELTLKQKKMKILILLFYFYLQETEISKKIFLNEIYS